ncbi:MAG: hypothetical protein R2764_15175 [Bacteroidales bacterium]
MVVFEYLTTENVSSNGETEFEHVMMKMVQMPMEQLLILPTGLPLTITETVGCIAGTNVEEWDDLGVVVIVQDYASRDVLIECSVENGEFATDANAF